MSLRKVKSDQNRIELSVVHSVYETKNKKVKTPQGIEVIPEEKMTKQLHVRKWFVKEGITSVEEYVTADHRVSRNRSIVFDKYSGRFYATFHGADEVMKHLSPKGPEVGFKKY